MAKLQSADILAEIEKEKPTKISAKPSNRRKENRARAEEVGASKPSSSEAELRVKLRDKVQCSMGNVPRFINEEFERLVNDSGMGKKEYFFHLLREQGADIPPYGSLDGRKL